MKRLFEIALIVKGNRVAKRTVKVEAPGTYGEFQIALQKVKSKMLSNFVSWEVNEKPPKH